MKKTLKIAFTILFAVLLVACGDNNNFGNIDNFDHEAQALIDNDSIRSFLDKHYYDFNVDSIKRITSNQTPLSQDANLVTMNVTESDVDYELYVYKRREGSPTIDKGFPTVMDSVLVQYHGFSLEKTDSLVEFEYRGSPIWFQLNAVIRGWTHGFTNFKNGDNNSGSNGPITFINGGKGVLIIPSGLAYRNTGTGIGTLINKSLIFYIDLFDFIQNTDHDNDGVPSYLEDPDGDGDPRNDDTDGDGLPNFADPDDDGDLVPTKDEDANGDGNPGNDFSDPNKPTIPDYLNPDIR